MSCHGKTPHTNAQYRGDTAAAEDTSAEPPSNSHEEWWLKQQQRVGSSEECVRLDGRRAHDRDRATEPSRVEHASRRSSGAGSQSPWRLEARLLLSAQRLYDPVEAICYRRACMHVCMYDLGGTVTLRARRILCVRLVVGYLRVREAFYGPPSYARDPTNEQKSGGLCVKAIIGSKAVETSIISYIIPFPWGDPAQVTT